MDRHGAQLSLLPALFHVITLSLSVCSSTEYLSQNSGRHQFTRWDDGADMDLWVRNIISDVPICSRTP